MKRALVILVSAFALVACAAQTPGYDAARPTHIVCGCHQPDECYSEAAALSKTGENAATGEKLLYFAQCACFEGSMAGCNTLSHFAKDFVRACDSGDDVKNSCTIAGFISHLHGVRVPPRSGRSFDNDEAKSKALFARGCEAGASEACAKIRH